MKQEMEVKLEKMQFLGIFGILQEAYNIIYAWRKIFSQITLFLIFPLSLFFLVYAHTSNHMIQDSLFQIIQTKSQNSTPRFAKLSGLIMSHKFANFLLFVIIYKVFLTTISIPSTSIVTYVVACTYTNGDEKVSFKQGLKVVAKVWKRVMITSFYSLGFSFTYDSVAACVFLLIVQVIIFRDGVSWHLKALILIVFITMYFVGFLYLSSIWMLSKVVSVLEELYGFKALMKSQKLLRGKMVAAMILKFFMILFVGVVQVLYKKVVVRGVVLGMISKRVLGIFCLVLLIHLLLFNTVMVPVLYFVCKLYHRENINLSTELLGLVEVYMSLKSNDVEVETERFLVHT